MPNSSTIAAVTAKVVSAVTALPVARNTATRAGGTSLMAAFTLSILPLY